MKIISETMKNSDTTMKGMLELTVICVVKSAASKFEPPIIPIPLLILLYSIKNRITDHSNIAASPAAATQPEIRHVSFVLFIIFSP